MALPFTMWILGSIVGCATSFLFINVPPPSTGIPALFSAAILAGCLCASYFKGTVNIEYLLSCELSASLLGDKSISMSSLFRSMAATDLVVKLILLCIIGY